MRIFQNSHEQNMWDPFSQVYVGYVGPNKACLRFQLCFMRKKLV